jgi:HEPN domain-containing protein
MKNNHAYITDFINRSFREVADKDYIAARISYRYGLAQQFLWFSQQALEKYLKAILLYNGKSTKNLNHNLMMAFSEVRRIADIPFQVPNDIQAFVRYMDDYGTNRYFEHPYYLMGHECLQLDKAVWHIRRYCCQMRTSVKKHDGTIINMFPYEIAKANHPYYHSKPNKYYLFGGYLESVLSNKRSTLRKELVWKNFYYGSYRKSIVKNYRKQSSSANPTHYLHPEVFPELDKLVKFSKPIRDYFLNESTHASKK